MNISEEQLKKLFELAGLDDKTNLQAVSENDISQALIEIERKIYSFTSGVKIDSLEDKKILIADDLELSIYQLSTVLKKIGIVPSVARHKEEAMSEMQKVRFDCIIIDLFIPDSSDGFDLIKEAVSKKIKDNQNLKIVVISGTDDTNLIDHCYELGVDFYIQKEKNWHTKLLKYLSSTFQSETNISYTRCVINNDIVSYFVKRFNDAKVFDAILKNINSSMYTGLKNILFDLKEVTNFDVENAYVFADIYKVCAENDGKLVLINPSTSVKEALAFAYLEDVIPYVESIEEGVSLIETSKITQ